MLLQSMGPTIIIVRLHRTVETLILCDLMPFSINYKETTEITCNGFRPISNMSDISLAIHTFSYQNHVCCTVGTLIFHGLKNIMTIYISFFTFNDRFVGTPYTCDQLRWRLLMPFNKGTIA